MTEIPQLARIQIMAAEEARDVALAKYNGEKKKFKLLMADKKELEAKYNDALGIKAKTKPLKVKPEKSKRKSESVVVLQSSDWHISEVVTPESVGGRNEFNLDICDSRIDKLYRKTVELVNIERSATTIETLVWWWGGDLVNGYLRDEDLELNSISPLEEAIWLKQRLQKGVEYFLQHFKKIIIPCSSGNHGRMTQKLRISTEHKNSLEYMVYQLLLNEYKDNPRVEIVNPRNTFTWVTVYGRDLRFHHGTFIRGGSGIGGIYPSLYKYLHRQNQTRKAYFDFIGHHHKYTPGETFCINPSLIGYNGYAVAQGFPWEPAAQALTFIEKNKGVTGTRKIYLQ